jgi:hypothetical protein
MPNHRHTADEAVTLPTKPAIPICILNDAVICRVNDGQQPIAAEAVTISARFLSEEERLLIGDLLRTGLSIRAIAARLIGSRPRSAERSAATPAMLGATGRSRPTGSRVTARSVAVGQTRQ